MKAASYGQRRDTWIWYPEVVQVVKNPPAYAGDARDKGSIPWSGRSPGEGNGLSTPVFLPGKSHGQRSLVGYSPWSRRESDRTVPARACMHAHTHTHRGADLHLGDTHCGTTCGVYLRSDFLLTPELFIIFIGCYTFFSYTGQLCHQLTALLLWWLTGREPDCQCRVCKRHRFDPWVRIPLEVEMSTTPVFLPGESQGQRSLAGYSLWDHKESDTT